MSATAEEPPPVLFKYCTAAKGLCVFTESRIRFTPVEEFNDPFELLPIIDLTGEELHKLTEKQLAKEYAFARVEPGKPLSPLDYRGFFKANYGEESAHAERTAASLPPDFSEQIRAAMGKRYGVLCLTESKENLVMWAHYADEHRGCVLEFDARHSFFQQPEVRSLRKVTYSEQRPRYVHRSPDSPNLYHKSLDWKAEAEWRSLGDFSTMEGVPGREGKIVHLTSLPAGVITAVYLGARMRESDSAEFARIAVNGRVKIFRATTDTQRFALNFAPYAAKSESD